ncbi:MAG: hypothetical protein BWX45_00794 [Deltaproteobacteria bacterium ADurb.Bin002]|nr:MAG: hypothetical protein BWX45_00794 [Deltaproteobacteria bacterium ADurb.Bin002]
MADKHAGANALAAHIFFFRIFHRRNHGAALGGQQPLRAGRRRRGFHDGFRNVLRAAESAADKHAGARRLNGIVQGRLAEAVLFQLNAQAGGKLFGFFGRHQTDRQNHHVEFFFREAAVGVGVFDQQVVGLLQFLDGGRHGADVADAVFVLGAVHEPVEILAVGADVHVENRGLQPLGVFLADDRLFGGVHTADRRAPAVAAGNIAGADALNEGDLFGLLAVGNSLHMAEEGAGRGQDALKLQGRDDVLVNAVAVFTAFAGVEDFKAGRRNHGADFNRFFFHFHIVVDGLGDTGLDALITFGADAAGQAAMRFRNRLGLGEADADFLEAGAALFRFHVRIFFPGNFGNVGEIRFVRQVFGPVFFATGLHILTLQITIDRLRRFLSGINGLDDRLRTGGNVAAGENARNVGGVGHGVVIQVVPLIDGNAAFLGDEGEIRFLADGRNDGVTFHNKFGAFDFNGTAAAALVRLAQFHARAFDARDFSILAHHALGGNEEFHFNSFFQRFFDFLGRSGHFSAGSAIQNENIL